MNKNKIDKQELKAPDAFVRTASSSWDWIENHAKTITTIVGIVFIGSISYSIYNYVERRSEGKANDAFYTGESQYTLIKEEFDKGKMASLMEEMAKSKKDPKSKDDAAKKPEGKVASGDLEKDYGSVTQELEKVVSQYPRTRAAAQAALILGGVYTEYKNPEKAIQVVSTVAKNLKSDQLLYALTHMMWGNALAIKGDCEQALGIWQKVIQVKSAAYLHADVNLRTGICYETLKQNDKAMDVYRKTSQEFADSYAGQTAKTLLRALEVKSKQNLPTQG